MALILSHPFRLAPNGKVVTVEQGSDQSDAEQIAVLALTVTGERPLVPAFGITDPTFAGVQLTEVSVGVGTFGPPRTVTDVRARPVSEVEQAVAIEFV